MAHPLRPMSFDPSAAAADDSGIFGLPLDPDGARVHVVPVPFDATASYRKGAARGPEAVLAASRQVDLFDLVFGKPYEAGIHMREARGEVVRAQHEATPLAQRILDVGGRVAGDAELVRALSRVEELGGLVNAAVREETEDVLDRGALPAILGGDHSVPFGGIEAVAARHKGLGILHIDAHLDLRDAYEGFRWSHASILHNVVERIDGVARVLHVGIRDLAEEELIYARSNAARHGVVLDTEWAAARLEGRNLRAFVREQLATLPRDVWISFDVDGLDPLLCPSTGTPVPGGLSWHEAMLWLEELARSGRRVVGLDLNEVSPGATPDGEDSWDAIVGARLLYRLIGCALATRQTNK